MPLKQLSKTTWQLLYIDALLNFRKGEEIAVANFQLR